MVMIEIYLRYTFVLDDLYSIKFCEIKYINYIYFKFNLRNPELTKYFLK